MKPGGLAPPHSPRRAPLAGQLKSGYAGLNAPARLALHAHRLQRDRVVRSADKDVGTEAEAERGAGRYAAVAAAQVSAADSAGRRINTPFKRRRLKNADVHADQPNDCMIAKALAVGAAEHAAQIAD